MPSSRPQAAFEPFSPGLDVEELVQTSPNFEWVTRVHCDMIEQHGHRDFEELVLKHVILGGLPLVIEGYEKKLDKRTFSAKWLQDFWGTKVVIARDLSSSKNVPLSIQHYLKNMPKLTNQWNDENYKDTHRQRMYLRDIDCHEVWARLVKEVLPSSVCYLDDGNNDSLEEHGKKPSSGRPGDLMSSLPPEMRAENLMCYIGHEGTYTPAHREMCATVGHNIMVEASTDGFEDGQATKAGSSVWFMTELKDRNVVSEYWLSRLGHDIEIEKHFAQINAWKQAPFKVYVVEQRPGDFILIPPLAPHQVWNRGTRTMKVAWNRTTVQTLEHALKEALFKARMVCRDEQYKNKAIIYYSLQEYSKLLENAETTGRISRRLLRDFKQLHAMYTAILVSESFSADMPEQSVEQLTFDGNITCSYCRCNIFNRFLTCPSCIGKLADGSEDTYDICLDCYAMGRSCRCISGLRWVEQWPWNKLDDQHAQWQAQILRTEGKVQGSSLGTLAEEIQRFKPRRTLAQVCQLELRRRPFHDVSKGLETPKKRSSEIELLDNNTDNNENDVFTKKRKVKPSEKFLKHHARCHVDCYWEPKWKQASCRKCEKSYCYGILFRAYDEMPQDILANPDWECPSCRNICGCSRCSLAPGFKRYVPKGTLLGHNTAAVADPRSIENLVDFSQANLAWIQKAGDDHEEDTLRLRRKLRQAKIAKAADDYMIDDLCNHENVPHISNDTSHSLDTARHNSAIIDPNLTTARPCAPGESGTFYDEGKVITNPEQALHSSSFLTDGGYLTPVPNGGQEWNNMVNYYPTDAVASIYPLTVRPEQLELRKSDLPLATNLTLDISLVESRSPGLGNQKRRHSQQDDDESSSRQELMSLMPIFHETAGVEKASSHLALKRSKKTSRREPQVIPSMKSRHPVAPTKMSMDEQTSDEATRSRSLSTNCVTADREGSENTSMPAKPGYKGEKSSTLPDDQAITVGDTSDTQSEPHRPASPASPTVTVHSVSTSSGIRKATLRDWHDSSEDDDATKSTSLKAGRSRSTNQTYTSWSRHVRD